MWKATLIWRVASAFLHYFFLCVIGKDAPIDVIADFIVAAQLAEKYAEESEDVIPVVAREPDVPNELLFEKMDKTLRLLEMGFSDHQISMAIEKIGTEGQISDLAESIIAGEVPGGFHHDLANTEKKVLAAPSAANGACPSKGWRFVGVGAQKKDDDVGSSSGTANLGETSKGKKLKDEVENADTDDRRKRLRPGYMGDSSSFMELPRMQDESKENTYGVPSAMQPRLSQVLQPDVAKRPYFLYGNITELSPYWWSKISSFLDEIQPEHVDTRLFSAFHRLEGYVHNLPTENRFKILPRQQLTLQDRTPEYLESVMGYPANHTKMGGVGLAERLKMLDYCFQTETLAYHLSVLKTLFPQGLRVLSLFSGIGGAEIALSRLDVHLRCVVTVEHCRLSRDIMKRWWNNSGQTGELVEIEDITRVSLKKLESLVERFEGFDIVICQNPPTPNDFCEESSRSQTCKFDFLLFNEFVRVSKRVRDIMELKLTK
ncbi:probable inactive DNA (cytosine-5)-methyltransferase DRM3 [Eutrema salsugineum]|uniref:probable inactive DNA (cytosine-5)-methyltransferase DRM3 n=1 Tax=Eutrema salsugineum TaxID=72664 RepID=UPI000CECFE14|nr:probable inactive DNA (cytosine-5)-methyltransferase DRM3 [Eutrema salsugineum]